MTLTTLLPATCCMTLTAVVTLLASGRKAEAALMAVICFAAVIGFSFDAEESRKEIRPKVHFGTWRSATKRRLESRWA